MKIVFQVTLSIVMAAFILFVIFAMIVGPGQP